MPSPAAFWALQDCVTRLKPSVCGKDDCYDSFYDSDTREMVGFEVTLTSGDSCPGVGAVGDDACTEIVTSSQAGGSGGP
jgi:hypothetical protein